MAIPEFSGKQSLNVQWEGADGFLALGIAS